MAQTITVKPLDGSKYRVTIEGSGTKTIHEVTVSSAELQRYGKDATPERLLQASFTFLLEREPKESILPRFRLSDIEAYFPDYSKQVSELL